MSLMRKLEDLVDKLTTGEQMQYILAGSLILIIIVSLLTVIMNLTGGGRKQEISELHFWCYQTGKEFVLKPEELYKNEPTGPEGGPPMSMGPMGMMFAISPYTNERTGIPMTQCPNCKKWFVPNYLLQYAQNPQEQFLPGAGPMEDLICPHCNTNIIQWYREHRKKR